MILLEKLKKKPFSCGILDDDELFHYSTVSDWEGIDKYVKEKKVERVNISLLAYLMEGGMLGITISNILPEMSDCEATVEIKSNTSSCIENFKNDMETLIEEISEGLLRI